MKNRRARQRHPKRVISLFLVISLVLSVIIAIRIQPTVVEFAVSTAESIMLNSANQAIVTILENGKVSYGDIVSLSQDKENYVTSLEINSYEVNRLKSLISNETARLADAQTVYTVPVPLGAFLGTVVTNGLGPAVPFKMKMTPTAFVDFSHEFKEAGINQVLHIITVEIKITATFVIMGRRKQATVKTSAIAAQTVIVGKSPEAFTNVIESDDNDIGGLLNDYGAESHY